MKKGILILGILVLVIIVSGCTSSTYNNYTGKNMSFQYPSDYTLDDSNNASIGIRDNNMTVKLHKGSSVIGVQVFPNDTNNESWIIQNRDLQTMNFRFEGQQVNNQTNIRYSVYKASGSQSSTMVYLFKVRNKTVMILGGNSQSELDVMNKILESIS